MANVPTFVHYGGAWLNGPAPYTVVSPGFVTWTTFKNQAIIMRAVPGDTAGNPSGLYAPFWDGMFGGAGVGAWITYHHLPGLVVGSLGSVWYGGGLGMGSDATYMQKLAQLYPSAPGFRNFKLGQAGGPTVGGYTAYLKPGGAGYTELTAQWGRAVAAAALAGDTLVVNDGWIVLSGWDKDLQNWGTAAATFEADLRAIIAGIRTLTGGTTAKLILVQPPVEIMQATYPGAAIAVREIQAKISRDTANIGLVDNNGCTFVGGPSGIGHLDPTGDKTSMDTESFLLEGLKIYACWRNMLAPPSTAPLGTGLAMVLSFGDSIEVGPINPVVMALTAQASLLGPAPGTVRAGEYIWNGSSQQIELFDVLLNSNTLGTTGLSSGPVATVLSELKKSYPNGVLVVHMGVNAAGLADPGAVGGLWKKGANAHYTTLLSNVRAAIRAAMTQAFVNGSAWTGRTVDMLGAIGNIGANDAYTVGAGTTFLAELRQLVADLRTDYGTRTNGRAMPVVVPRPHKDMVLGRSAERAAIRLALKTLEKEDAQFGWIDMDDQELNRDDQIHDGVEASLARGRRSVQKLLALGFDQPAVPAPEAEPATGVDPATVKTAITDAMAQSPDVAGYQISRDGHSVQRRSLQDQIAAAEWLQQQAARDDGYTHTLADFNP